MNKVILEGRIATDIKAINNGVTFNVAVRRNYKDKASGKYEADFIRVAAFGASAKFVTDFFSKGDPISIAGRWTTGSYVKDGVTIYTNTCIAEEFGFVVGAALKKNTQQSVQPVQPPFTQNPFSGTPF